MKDLASYVYPSIDIISKKILSDVFWLFFLWNIYKNYEYNKRINFKTAPNGRTSGTFTNYDSLDDKIDSLYYYMQYIKFGFGRSVRDASRLIMLGHISRSQGLDYVNKYDSEFPETYLPEVLDYLSLSKDELISIIDKHRNLRYGKKMINEIKV